MTLSTASGEELPLVSPTPEPKYSRFLKTSLGITLGAIAATALCNWWVDPFSYFGNNRLGVYGSSERQFKATYIDDYSHNALLMGSSMVGYINPQDLVEYQFFNASFSGALPEEMPYFLKHYASKDLKLVVIGLDVQSMSGIRTIKPEKEFDFPVPGDIKGTLENLLSFKVLQESLSTIKLHSQGVPTAIHQNGARNSVQKDEADSHLQDYDYRDNIKYLVKEEIPKFNYLPERMKVVADLKQHLDDRGIPYVVFLNPVNRRYLEVLQAESADDEFSQIRQELHRIFPDLVDLSQSQYSHERYFFKRDIIHYKSATGKQFMNDILSNHPSSGT